MSISATLQGEKGTSSLSLANESQFLLITRASISEVMNSVNQQQTSNPSVETKVSCYMLKTVIANTVKPALSGHQPQ